MARRRSKERDFLDEIMEASTVKNPDFPQVAAAAYQQRLLGQNLAQKRQRLGLSQAEVARRMASTQRIVSKIENGGDVQVSTLRRYVQAIEHDLKLQAIRRRKAS